MNSITVNDKNPFFNNPMESMCIVCTKDLSQWGKQKSKSVKTVLPEIDPPTKVFEALKLISNLSVDNEALRVCLLCYCNTSLVIQFQWQCNQSAANIKACIDNQTVEESDEAADIQELIKNETSDENFFISMKADVTPEEIVVTSFDGTVETADEEACKAEIPEVEDSSAQINQKSCEVEVDVNDANIEPDLDDNKKLSKLEKSKVYIRKKKECPHCHKMFKSNYMNVHLRTHTGELPFKCEICKKGFTAQNGLMYHMRIHDDNKHYLCTFCGRTFRMSGALNKHIRTHTGERPYSCEICGKTFNNTGNRNVHRTTHTDEKPFECDECPKRFSNRGLLSKHKLVHLKVKPIECVHCGMRFVMKYYLNKHLANSCKGIHSK